MTTIAKNLEATERDRAIARTIVSQVSNSTKLGNGFTNAAAITSGVEMDFRLCRPYGHRTVEITLTGMDYYNVTVYRFGRNFVKHLVKTYKEIDCFQLDEIVWDGIALSCKR
jgi:hypothetical protein